MSFLGIDVGTQGARTLVCDEHGRILARADRPFPPPSGPALPDGWHEQSPVHWWTAVVQTLREVLQALKDNKIKPSSIRGISVTSTSGTVCLVDRRGEPLGPALMYNDGRSAAEAQEVQEAGESLARKLGYRFSSSFALPKLLWLLKNDGRRPADARYFISPTDFIIGKLTGRFDRTDYSNALKTGYDLIDHRWPSFIEDTLRLSADKLPEVVAPGTLIGEIQKKTADETGLASGTPVLAGMTDGCASQVSTGAVAPGQWNSTLGTTLVIKGVTRDLIRDPDGRVYCHRHPDGFWLPGGASNTGGECISRRFKASELNALNARALAAAPTGIIAYPLMKKGERFPFVNAEAEGFLVGGSPDEAGIYTAYLEGVGYIERLGYAVLERLGAETGDEVFAAGGAVKAEAWLQLRADILQKTMLVPAESGGAMGAAIVAAGGTAFKGVVPAAESMVRIVKRVEPRPELKDAYDERYDRFRAELKNRGYITS